MSVVPDASVVVKWFVREDGHPAALSLLERSGAVVAPDLVFAETANVVWKKLRRGELTLQQANQTCEALPEFFTRVVPTASLIQDALRLAWRLDHPVYDCLHLACAEREGAKLVTADQQFARLLRASGMDRLVLSLEEISSSANAKLD